MNAAEVVVGIGGARRNAALAVVRSGAIEMAGELERFTRLRAAGFSGPAASAVMREMLERCGLDAGGVSTFASGETGLTMDSRTPERQYPHAYAHACASFLTSPFQSAAILVCDSSSDPEVTLWRGQGPRISAVDWAWAGQGLARAYSAATAAIGFLQDRDEHRLEALARVAAGRSATAAPFVEYHDNRLFVSQPALESMSRCATAAKQAGLPALAGLAHSVQAQIGDVLLRLLRTIRSLVDEEDLCLAGGLFFNTYLNSVASTQGPFARCFIPPNPGNAGLAIGAALAAAAPADRPRDIAYLGPAYNDTDIKKHLDNCKLTYDYVGDEHLMSAVATALRRGFLVGWFQGPMEWGPRALGHRSILANPLKPHALANLNAFLKQGDDHRTYGIMLLEQEAERYLRDPRPSRFMEFEADLRDPERFRELLPYHGCRVRYQTVGPEQGRLCQLLSAVEQETGCAMVINTSFNGFHEPIACSPRDAIRIFYGTGLDMLVAGNFILTK